MSGRLSYAFYAQDGIVCVERAVRSESRLHVMTIRKFHLAVFDMILMMTVPRRDARAGEFECKCLFGCEGQAVERVPAQWGPLT